MDRKLLSQEVIDILNYRIQQEEFSSRLYEYMSNWLNDKGYMNLAKLYESYAAEEKKHAGWAEEFLLSYGVNPTLKALPSPVMEFESCTQILEATLEHELKVTEQCNELAAKALNIRHFPLHALGLQYCKEQVEEIDKAINLLDIRALTSDRLVFDNYVGENLLD